MERILSYIRFVLKRIIFLIVRISTFFIFHNSKKFPPARLFHPARLLDSWEYSHLCNKQPEWTKRVWKAEFFVHYVKKGFYYIEKTNRGVGGQKLNTTLPNHNILLFGQLRILSLWQITVSGHSNLRSQILAEDVSFHMKHCLFDQYQNWSGH